jgi:putative transposase
MIEPDHTKLTITEQCKLLNISRAAYYYEQRERSVEADLEDLKHILEVLREIPFYGYRKVSRALLPEHPHLKRKRVRRIMRRFGLRALYPRRSLSKPGKGHKKYPYLLRGKKIRYPNQVWATDLTYLKLPGGFVYLAAIVDLFSRKVLSWRLSNSMDPAFCVAALEEAIKRYGEPAIFNTDQGSQFTSEAFISVLERHSIEISMDGKGRALDNVYVERLWRSLKYEDIYLKSYETMAQIAEGVDRYFQFYNSKRFHQSLDYRTPEEMYQSFVSENKLPLAA